MHTRFSVSGLLDACKALTSRHHRALRAVYAICWVLLFCRHSFDFNERFFRIPLLLLTLPVLAGLPHAGIASFLRRSPLTWGVLGMILAAWLAGTMSPFPGQRSFSHIIFGWFVLALAGFTMRLTFPDNALRFFALGAGAGLLASALWAAFGLWAGSVSPETVLAGSRLMLFTGYPATLGLMAGFTLVLLGYCYRHGRVIISRKADIVLMLSMFTLLLLSQSRLSLLAVLGAGALICVRAARRPWRTAGAAALLLALLAGAALLLGQAGPLKDSRPYQRMIVLLERPLEDSSVSGRLGLWEAAWGTFLEHPLTGCGLRMFKPAYAEYMEQHRDRLQKKYPFVEPEGGHAHNLVLGVLTEMGLLGLLPLLLIYGAIFRPRGNMPPGSDGDCLRMLFIYLLILGLAEFMLPKIIYSDLFFSAVGLFAGACFPGGQSGRQTA